VLDSSSDVWGKASKFYRWARQHHGIKHANVLDIDEVCIFDCGHTHAAQRKSKGSSCDRKQDSGFRRACNGVSTSTVIGRTLEPVVGKARDSGKEDDSGLNSKQMCNYESPGIGWLGDYPDIHANESGFFDAETYSALVLTARVGNHAAAHSDRWSLLLHERLRCTRDKYKTSAKIRCATTTTAGGSP
jgi:hypothetical protein